MKIDRLEAHDRFQYLTNSQSLDIGKCCQDIIDQRPFGEYSFYIFSHKRQIGLDERVSIFDNDVRTALIDPTYTRKFRDLSQVPTDRIIWQPRLTKPKAQTNSMLFKAYPGTDVLKVIWLLPAEELWDQFTKDKMTENKLVSESIHLYRTNKNFLESKEDDDLSDETIDFIYREISLSKKPKKFVMI